MVVVDGEKGCTEKGAETEILFLLISRFFYSVKNQKDSKIESRSIVAVVVLSMVPMLRYKKSVHALGFLFFISWWRNAANKKAVFVQDGRVQEVSLGT